MLFVMLLTGCAGVTDHGSSELNLTVLHTNDYHGSILPVDSNDGKMGGVAELAAVIKTERAQGGNVLLLDAGDINVSRQFISMAFEGDLDIALYNKLGYDAAAFGNNEFQRGAEFLEAQMKLAQFPFLGANVKKADGSYLGKPWIIKEMSGFKVGIFGLSTTASKEYLWSGYLLTDEISAAKQAVSELKAAGADIVIALTHLGMEQDLNTGMSSEKIMITSNELARQVKGIDLIIDGHSHTYIEAPVYVNGVPVVSAGEHGKYLGKAVISASGGAVNIDWQVLAVKDVAADNEIAGYLSGYAEKVDVILKEELGEALADFEFGDRLPLRQETSLGDLISDAAVIYVTEKSGAADFFFMNGGTIRNGLKKGIITYGDVNNAIPFNDNLILHEVKGADLSELFKYMASIQPGSRAFPQISKGAGYTADFSGNEGKLVKAEINSRPIEPDKIYKVLTVDFISGGGNGYTLSEKSLRSFNTGLKLRDAVAQYIKDKKRIEPATDGRIKILNPPEKTPLPRSHN
jgi:5'-nucleotidase/UDP-sugar diphosphatase